MKKEKTIIAKLKGRISKSENKFLKLLFLDESSSPRFLKGLETAYLTYRELKKKKKTFSFKFSIGKMPGAQRPSKSNSRNKKGEAIKSHMYDPVKNKRFKSAFESFVVDKIGDEFLPALGEAEVVLTVYKKIPGSFSGPMKVLAEMGYIKPLKTPDNDNYEKLVWDALNGILFLDDKQVTDNTTKKRYSIHPRIEVEIKIYKQKFYKNQ